MMERTKRLSPDEMKPIREEVKQRDEYACCKCSRNTDLEVHHIQALSDGGTNDLENLITLCAGCHQEWGLVECVSTLTFEQWLDIPPYTYLLALYLTDFKVSHKEARYRCERMFLHDKNTREADGTYGKPPVPKKRRKKSEPSCTTS